MDRQTDRQTERERERERDSLSVKFFILTSSYMLAK